MTKAQVLQSIIDNITDNANNEITGAVLRPVLNNIVNQINDLTGDLANLTDPYSNLVNAINDLLNNTGNGTGIILLTGTQDPNTTPPTATPSIADFYSRTVSGSPFSLYIYNGVEWVLIAGTSGVPLNKKFIESIDADVQLASLDTTLRFLGSAVRDMDLISPILAGSGRIVYLVNASLVYNVTLSGTALIDFDDTIVDIIPPQTSYMIQAKNTFWYVIMKSN